MRMISSGLFFAASKCWITWPPRILFCTISPFKRCRACDKRRLAADIAGADRLARRTAESREEVIGGRPVGNLHRPCAQRQAAKLVLRFRHLRDAVAEHLGLDPPHAGVGEVPLVAFVAGVGLRRPLIGLREADIAHQPLEVVLVLDQLAAKLLVKLGIDRRIADANVVDRLDDADAEEVGPDAIGHAGGEEGIVGRGQPVGQHLAAVLAVAIGLRPAEEFRFHHAAADGMVHLAAAAIEDDRLAIVFALLAADLAEEGGEAVVVVHRPAVEGMVVALGALHPHAHEDLGHVLGRLQRVGLDLVEIRRRRGERAAAGGQQLPHDLVQRHVAGDLLGQPGGIEDRSTCS